MKTAKALFGILGAIGLVAQSQVQGAQFSPLNLPPMNLIGAASDSAANTYVLGTFTNTISLGGRLFSSLGGTDYVLAQYRPNGNFGWAISFGTPQDENAFATTLNVTANAVFVSGATTWSIHLVDTGSNLVNTAYNTGNKVGGSDGFLFRFSLAGVAQWQASITGTSASDYGSGLYSDSSGNLYWAGTFNGCCPTQGGATLTGGDGTSVAISAPSYATAFLSKMSPAGGILWVAKAYNRDVMFLNVTVDSQDNAYVLGWGAGGTSTTVVNADGSSGAVQNAGTPFGFIAKFNALGILQWSASPIGALDFTYHPVCMATGGHVLFGGRYSSGPITFPSTSGNSLQLAAASGYDGFIAEYDANGKANWAAQIPGTNDQSLVTLCSVSSSVWVGGLTTGGISLPGLSLAPIGVQSVFTLQMNTNGQVLSGTVLGGTGPDALTSMQVVGNAPGLIAGNQGGNFSGWDVHIQNPGPFVLTSSQSFLTNGLVAYYPFNGNANDASGNANNGTLVGTDLQFSLDRFGRQQSSLFLNTTSTYAWNLAGAYVAVPRPTSLDFNCDFTLSLWVNHSSGVVNAPENLISNGHDDYSINLRNHCSYSDHGGEDLLGFGGGARNTGWFYPTWLAPVRDSWWQITVVRSGTNVTLFKNGSVLTNGVMTTTVNNPLIWFGRFEEVPPGNGSCYPLIGGIDDVRMYNRALSTNEVQQLYAYESTPPQSFLTKGLAAYYPFNGNANDASGNGSNGVAFNLTYGQNRFGEAGAAASFNGSSSFAYVTNFFSSQPTQITYSVWFKTANQVSVTNTQFWLAGATGYILDSGWDYGIGLNNPNPVWGNGPIIGDCDGFGMYKYVDRANYYYCDITNFIFMSNEWHHVVGVFDGSAMSLFLDGVFRSALQYPASAQGLHSLEIGAHSWGNGSSISDQYWGSIDDVRVYFRALSSNEVSQLYAYESAPAVSGPSIITQPLSQSVNQGSPVRFNVSATGSGLNFQWLLNNATIPGATNASYSLASVTTNDARNYSVIVSNAAGSVTSSNAVLTVIPPPRTGTGTATLFGVFVVAVNITDGGCGYTNTPRVRLIGGGGSGAEAIAVVSNGVVTAINVFDAGYGYTNAPWVVIDPPFIPNPVLDIAAMSFLSFSNLTESGFYQLQRSVAWYWSNQPVSFTATDALYTQMVAGVADSGDYRLALNPVPAQAFATAVVDYGFVVHATVTSGGSGYVTSPAVTMAGGGGSNATAVSKISGGVVTEIRITDAGIGYTNPPTVRIAPPPAAAVAPSVLPVMRLNATNLTPYASYQIEFKPAIGGTWGNWSGGLFSPTDVTNSQYLFVTNGTGLFRLQHGP